MINENVTLGIVGLGYIGLPLAIEFGKSRPTIGFDTNKSRIDQLNIGIDGTLEVGKESFREASHLQFTSDLQSLSECGVFIVTVPTPIKDVNRPDLTPLKMATESVGRVLKHGDIVIFESTVFPGCTEEICVPILEAVSGLVFNQGFFCGYSPERINPGDKVNTLTKIKKITSGSTEATAEIVDQLYGSIITAGTFKASSIKVAEAAKVIENSQRDLNIAFVNELSLIFKRLSIDTSEVLDAASTKWNFLNIRPGLVGGHCIGVDPYYLTYKAEEVGYHPEIILAGRKINDSMAQYTASNLIQMMLQNNIDVAKSTVGVMGITFKENCPDIRNSKVVDVVRELQKWNVNVVVEDPWADPKDVEETYSIKLSSIEKENPVDSLLVAVGHKEFRQLSPRDLKELCVGQKPVLVDVKALFDKTEVEAVGFSVFRL